MRHCLYMRGVSECVLQCVNETADDTWRWYFHGCGKILDGLGQEPCVFSRYFCVCSARRLCRTRRDAKSIRRTKSVVQLACIGARSLPLLSHSSYDVNISLWYAQICQYIRNNPLCPLLSYHSIQLKYIESILWSLSLLTRIYYVWMLGLNAIFSVTNVSVRYVTLFVNNLINTLS